MKSRCRRKWSALRCSGLRLWRRTFTGSRCSFCLLYWYESRNIDAEYLVFRKQHQECAKAVKDKLESMKMKRLATLDDRASLKLLQQVLSLNLDAAAS